MLKGRRRWTSQLNKRELNRPLSFLCLFILFGLSVDWMMPSQAGECGFSLLSLLIQMLISSGSTLRDTSKNKVFPANWASISLVKLTLT